MYIVHVIYSDLFSELLLIAYLTIFVRYVRCNASDWLSANVV